MSLTVTIPIRTGLGLNAREHWAQRSARVARERKAVALCFPRDMRRYCESYPEDRLVVHLMRASVGVLDDDNLPGALKGVRDEVAKQLGLANDSNPHVAWTYAQTRVGRGEHWVSIRLEVLP